MREHRDGHDGLRRTEPGHVSRDRTSRLLVGVSFIESLGTQDPEGDREVTLSEGSIPVGTGTHRGTSGLLVGANSTFETEETTRQSWGATVIGSVAVA